VPPAAGVPHRAVRLRWHGGSVDLIGIDTDRDFTVRPWISQQLGRPMQVGDVILGAARDLPLGSEIVLFGKPFRIYAKLGRTGVGTHERGIFMSSSALLDGTLALVAMMFVSIGIVASVLFSAIVTERRGELGLLKAIGARRRQVVGMMLTEAMIATGAGGLVGVVLGVLLLRVFERSLVYYLTEIGIPFIWLDRRGMLIIAGACVLAATLIGGIGVLTPAWRASRRDPHDLIRGEG
jgi:hypothetical protein